jgi:transposase
MEEELIKRRRTFSVVLKQEKVKQLEDKLITVGQICKLYQVSKTAVYRWVWLYGSLKQRGEHVVVEKESEANKVLELLKKVAELERLLGQKQVEVEYLKKVVEFGSEITKTDIKKKFNTQC